MRSLQVFRRFTNWWRGSDSRPAFRRRPHFNLQTEALEARQLLAVLSIAQENQLPGTSPAVWDITGSGSANIQGYAAQFSINHGERVDFKIDTDAADYRIDVYRMGYYQGLGARLVTTINPNAALANNQPNPITNFDTGLVDAGNWRVSASWNTTSDTVSGVYVAKLTREDGTFGESHIIFVVRDDDNHSDLLLQTSDTNWVAYSDYGGSSLYGNNFLPKGRAYEVSYNRPLTTRDRANTTFFFGAEYPMVRFLEANGYNVSYTTGIDTDRRGAELLEHKVFISVGHDEYWSGQQRDNVEAARDAGVSLAFFSGNEMFWKTRWADSIDGSNTPYTTLVSYKETHDNAKTDPMEDVWTGTWRDPRFASTTDGGQPENALTGTIFTVNGDSIVGRKITVGAADGQMRFWRNTRVANLTGTQTTQVGDYVLGYEWDEDLDNGFRPAGLVHLSETTADVSAYLQDYGSTYAPGTATHHLTLYRASSGALVFGAGTIQYSWGLDSFHDGQAAATDVALQQATVNLFADMGVQPKTLMSTLVYATMSTDYLAPISTITSPTDGMLVSAGTPITIRGTAQEQGGGRVGAVEVSVDGGATWHPADGRENWTYTWTPRSSGSVTIRSRASDDSANVETPSAGITINPPVNAGVYSLWDNGTTPATVDSGDKVAVEVGVRLRVDVDGFITALRFYKSAANTGIHTAHLWSSTGALLGTATFTSETASGWQQVEFESPIAVRAGQTYVASYTAPVGHYSVSRSYFTTLGVDNGPLHATREGDGGSNGVYNYTPGSFPTQSYQGSNYWVDVVLNTSIAADVTAPTVKKFGKAGAGTIVTTTSSFTITFDEAMAAASISASTITLVKPDARMVPGGCCPTPGGWCSGCPLLNAVNNTTILATVSYDAAARTATVTPNSPLESATVYTIIVGAGGVKDIAGNALETDTWSSFYTSSQPAPVQSTIWNASTVPATVDSGDNSAVELGLRFTADTDGTITGARFYKAAANTGAHTATLWSASGQKLATATFTGETASGWQQVNFATPVAVTAGTTYVISYHTNAGHYSVSRNAFASPLESGPLNVPTGAGVYAYGTTSVFPNASYQNSNYFVDPVFTTTSGVDTLAPTITNFNPFDGTTNVPVNPTVNVYFSEDLNPSTVTSATVMLLDGGNRSVPATLVYNQSTRTATLTPTSALANSMTYTIFVAGGGAGVRDLAGNPMAQNLTSAFLTVAAATPDTTLPTITSFTPGDGTEGVVLQPTVKVTFSEPMNAATLRSNTVYMLEDGHALVSTSMTYNAATKTVTLIPDAPLKSGVTYTIYVLGGVSGVKDLANNALAGNVASYFTTEAGSTGGSTDTTPPVVSQLAPTGSSVAVNATLSATFNEPMDAASINSSTVFLRNAGGTVISTSLSYNASTNTVTLTPSAALANSTTYTLVVKGGASGVKDTAGNALAVDATSSFTTVAAAPTFVTSSLWSGSTTPSVADSGDGSAVELGVKFSATTSGYITGLRFYKSAANTGTHKANLWSASGQLLATANFTSETGSGWQQVNFASPVAITAGTSYIASYFAPSGRYSVNRSYFNSQYTSGSLKVPVSGGVYRYGTGGFPSSAYQGSNYWVDVVLSTTPPVDNTAPTITAFAPTNGSTGAATGVAPSVTFSEDVNSASINSSTVYLRNASNVVVPTSVAYNSATRTVTLTPTAALANSTTYTIVVKGGASGVKDTAGNALAADAASSFTTAAVAAPVTASLWPTTTNPSTVDSGDNSAVELGVKFSSTTSGYITGIRFYKSAANTGNHTASLWSASGQLLATGTFVNETASGWQTVLFASPVAITAGTTYVASYHTNSGHYAVNRNYFASQYTSGPLRVAASGGVYAYGAGGFPASSYQASNYWVDPLFASSL